jgi:hypothetical protein
VAALRFRSSEPHEREADPTLVERVREMLRSLTDDGMQADLASRRAASPSPSSRYR